jgi:hypothetical protein
MCPQYIAGQIGLGDRKSVTEKRESGCRQTPEFLTSHMSTLLRQRNVRTWWFSEGQL